jgi:uncharacterized membrane protein
LIGLGLVSSRNGVTCAALSMVLVGSRELAASVPHIAMVLYKGGPGASGSACVSMPVCRAACAGGCAILGPMQLAQSESTPQGPNRGQHRVSVMGPLAGVTSREAFVSKPVVIPGRAVVGEVVPLWRRWSDHLLLPWICLLSFPHPSCFSFSTHDRRRVCSAVLGRRVSFHSPGNGLRYQFGRKER